MTELKNELVELNEVKDVNVEDIQNEVALRVRNTPEVKKIADSMELSNVQAVMSFGKETADEISTFSDRILSSVSKSSVEDSGKLLKNLSGIMKQFNPQDFVEKKPGFLSKIFNKAQNEIEKLLNKYKTMDQDIEQIYIEIKKYEGEINQTNTMMEEMFEQNMNYYEQLEKYVQGGYLIVDKTKNEWLPGLEEKAKTGDPVAQQEYNNGLNFLEMVEQRIQDLEMAKMVSLQTAPQIKLIQKGNYNLLRKLNSSIVVTLPVFKTGLIQAITMKRQKIQADSMKALDDATNEMLIRNAQNISQNSVQIAQLSGGSSIQIETLEQTFDTILQGINETMAIETENRQKREDSKQKLVELQNKFKETRF